MGEVFGALVFGRLSDALGRKNLFIVTLAVYLTGNALTALTWGNSTAALIFLYLTRFIAGAGIGGEYAAINSAIDEMMPAKYRGRVDIGVNGTYWGGAIIGTLGTYILLNNVELNWAWRIGFLIGPLTIGRLFDTIGRRKMIAGTYLLSAALLAITAFLFNAGALNAITQTIAWSVIFFASAGASSAYLTVSEIFPLEIRAQAIAVFFAIAQCFGTIGPVLYGALIGEGEDPGKLFLGFLIDAGVMAIGGIVEAVIGIDAEGKSLEDVATPLSAVSAVSAERTV
ncbi:MAG TPA: MFS transporter [Actinoplanes sp.]|nr:MFS transporter [Actinoplanes sp.]